MNHVAAEVDRRAFLARAGAAAALLGSTSTLLAACGGSSSGGTTATPTVAGKPPARPTGTLRIANSAEPGFLDPTRSVTPQELGVERPIYQALAQWKPDFSGLEGDIASSWTSNDDATEWIFELRDGLTFSDGEPVDATAVRKSFEYYKNPASFWSSTVPAFREIDDSDPTRIRLVTKAPAPDLARTMPVVFIISPKLLAQGPDTITKQPVGSGPYKLERWDRGRSIVLVPNDSTPGAYFERLEFTTISQAAARANALTSGQVDIITRADPTAVQRLRGDSKLNVYSTPGWDQAAIFFKVDRPLVSDPRVRQAIAYALDVPSIVRTLFNGQAEAQQAFGVPGLYGFSEPQTRYDHDPEKARGLLRAAGVAEGTKLSLLSDPGTINSDLVGQAMVAQLADAGIELQFKVEDTGVVNKELFAPKPRFDMFLQEQSYINGGPFGWDIDIIGLTTGYRAPQYLAHMSKIASTPDGPARIDAIAAGTEYIAQQLPWLPLYQVSIADVAVKQLGGWTVAIDGFVPRFDRAYFVA